MSRILYNCWQKVSSISLIWGGSHYHSNMPLHITEHFDFKSENMEEMVGAGPDGACGGFTLSDKNFLSILYPVITTLGQSLCEVTIDILWSKDEKAVLMCPFLSIMNLICKYCHQRNMVVGFLVGSASSTMRKTPCMTSHIAAFCNNMELNCDSMLGVSIAAISWFAADGRKRDIIGFIFSSSTV